VGTTPIWGLLEPSNKGHKFKLNLFTYSYYLDVIVLMLISSPTWSTQQAYVACSKQFGLSFCGGYQQAASSQAGMVDTFFLSGFTLLVERDQTNIIERSSDHITFSPICKLKDHPWDVKKRRADISNKRHAWNNLSF